MEETMERQKFEELVANLAKLSTVIESAAAEVDPRLRVEIVVSSFKLEHAEVKMIADVLALERVVAGDGTVHVSNASKATSPWYTFGTVAPLRTESTFADGSRIIQDHVTKEASDVEPK
jgi:hypothetical protein